MHYKNFRNATYAPAQYLRDTAVGGIEADIGHVGRYLKLDKIYLETYRSDVLVPREKMAEVKALFEKYGYMTSGGITTTTTGTLMGAFCYTDPEHLKRLGDVSAYTAEMFDEVMIDDFYFTNCRCENCIKAKGGQTWAEFRLKLMQDVSENIVIKRAKEANPKAHVIIKYPNWYESFPACGYNLEDQPPVFDSIYTGTETRDPHTTHQNLQRYLSYFLPRYFENVKPGLNGGGWHDLFECTVEDYIQQITLTLFAKCRENMHFCFPLMARFPSAYMAAAGAVSDDIDLFLGKLGSPAGIACYKPYHSSGERHLYDFLGMLGLPLEPYPDYPAEAKTVLLTGSSAYDDGITGKIKASLLAGSSVFITSGLYSALKDRGIQDILPMEVTARTVTSDRFTFCPYAHNNTEFHRAEGDITLKHIAYSTNDLWVLAAAQTPYYSHPLLLRGSYGPGWLYVLNIPDAPADLYKLPAPLLKALRGEFGLPVSIECGARVGLFLYGNDSFIIQSFKASPEKVRIRIPRPGAELTRLDAPPHRFDRKTEPEQARQKADESVFEVLLMPGRYAAFMVG
jgi:hypothetical protein